MLLDRLLNSVTVRVEPFALCLLSTGWRLRLPGPPDVMFHFVLRGSGTLRGPGSETYRLDPFWLAIVPRGVPHALQCGDNGRSTQAARAVREAPGGPRFVAGSPDRVDFQVACGIVHVDYGDSLGLFGNLREMVVADLSGYPPVRAAFESILAEQARPSPGGETLTAALMSQCLVYLLRHLSEGREAPLPWLSAAEDPELARAVDRIFEDPAAAHTVASLADQASLSRSAFAERFQETFGCTPMTFLRDVRLRRAARLLRSNRDLSIDQVAHRVGFSSRSHFSYAFSDRFGISPAAFREAPS